MKRLILLIMLCLPLSAMAQSKGFDRLMDKYSMMQGCTAIVMEKEMLRSMGVKSGMDSVSAISIEKESLLKEFGEDVTAATKGYSVMMAVNSGGESVKICGLTEGDCIKELIVLTITSTEGVVVRVKGDNISLSEATSLIEM